MTGAFGYSGGGVAERLLDRGVRVRTLTGSPGREHPLQGRVEVSPLAFDDPARLVAALRGSDVLVNTYWVRFNHELFTRRGAVENTRILFAAAREAGVRRVVHVSITNPSADSPYEYFRAKAVLEEVLRTSGMSYAILRPAVLFGGRDILVNNMAWVMRTFPVVGVFGDGRYRIRPTHVEDLADLAVEQALGADDVTLDAVGPETYTYRELLAFLGEVVGCRRPLIRVPRALGHAAVWLTGRLVRDVILTRDEIDALCADLLATEGPATGQRRLSEWAREHADTLGRHYHSELRRRTDRAHGYGGDASGVR